MAEVKGRRTRRIRKIIDEMRAAREQPCRRCGQTIDYDADRDDPNGFSAGHIKSWKLYPELREDRGNFQPEHLRCNQSAGTKDGSITNGVGLQSRNW